MLINILHEIDQITVKPGQTFTVWLDTDKRPNYRKAIQVELRVTKDGKPEIFTHLQKIEPQDFEYWKAL